MPESEMNIRTPLPRMAAAAVRLRGHPPPVEQRDYGGRADYRRSIRMPYPETEERARVRAGIAQEQRVTHWFVSA